MRDHFGLPIGREELHAQAVEWSVTRGSRSGRVAWQFIQDLAGRLGMAAEGGLMARIEHIEAGFYRIPLEIPLTDSTHGEMLAFELNTVRLRDGDGAEGVGYTYTCGRNGAAIDAILRRDLPEQLLGQEAERIEAIWLRLWWGQHYGGRGGPAVLAQSAVDMALWDLRGAAAGAAALDAARRV